MAPNRYLVVPTLEKKSVQAGGASEQVPKQPVTEQHRQPSDPRFGRSEAQVGLVFPASKQQGALCLFLRGRRRW